jgi:ectoine hydroxylase-related dioxygenase (phytanoyl-CoA dioxygenase family)
MSPSNTLTKQEIAFFHQNGYLGPIAACSPDEMVMIRAEIERDVLATNGPNPKNKFQSRHMDQPVVYNLATCPAILERMKCLYGQDLILWATFFFVKEPGGKEIPWHQDLNYWPLEPVINISAWIAIDPATIENSCVRIIPGSHKKVLPHTGSPDGMAFQEMADPKFFDASQAINMELKPGEFFLFNEKLLHQSEPNRSQKRRIGMTVRVTVPFVKLEQDSPPLHPGHEALLIAGKDCMEFNRLGKPPLRKLKSDREPALA